MRSTQGISPSYPGLVEVHTIVYLKSVNIYQAPAKSKALSYRENLRTYFKLCSY